MHVNHCVGFRVDYSYVSWSETRLFDQTGLDKRKIFYVLKFNRLLTYGIFRFKCFGVKSLISAVLYTKIVF